MAVMYNIWAHRGPVWPGLLFLFLPLSRKYIQTIQLGRSLFLLWPFREKGKAENESKSQWLLALLTRPAIQSLLLRCGRGKRGKEEERFLFMLYQGAGICKWYVLGMGKSLFRKPRYGLEKAFFTWSETHGLRELIILSLLQGAISVTWVM